MHRHPSLPCWLWRAALMSLWAAGTQLPSNCRGSKENARMWLPQHSLLRWPTQVWDLQSERLQVSAQLRLCLVSPKQSLVVASWRHHAETGCVMMAGGTPC